MLEHLARGRGVGCQTSPSPRGAGFSVASGPSRSGCVLNATSNLAPTRAEADLVVMPGQHFDFAVLIE